MITKKKKLQRGGAPAPPKIKPPAPAHAPAHAPAPARQIPIVLPTNSFHGAELTRKAIQNKQEHAHAIVKQQQKLAEAATAKDGKVQAVLKLWGQKVNTTGQGIPGLKARNAEPEKPAEQPVNTQTKRKPLPKTSTKQHTNVAPKSKENKNRNLVNPVTVQEVTVPTQKLGTNNSAMVVANLSATSNVKEVLHVLKLGNIVSKSNTKASISTQTKAATGATVNQTPTFANAASGPNLPNRINASTQLNTLSRRGEYIEIEQMREPEYMTIGNVIKNKGPGGNRGNKGPDGNRGKRGPGGKKGQGGKKGPGGRRGTRGLRGQEGPRGKSGNTTHTREIIIRHIIERTGGFKDVTTIVAEPPKVQEQAAKDMLETAKILIELQIKQAEEIGKRDAKRGEEMDATINRYNELLVSLTEQAAKVYVIPPPQIITIQGANGAQGPKGDPGTHGTHGATLLQPAPAAVAGIMAALPQSSQNYQRGQDSQDSQYRTSESAQQQSRQQSGEEPTYSEKQQQQKEETKRKAKVRGFWKRLYFHLKVITDNTKANEEWLDQSKEKKERKSKYLNTFNKLTKMKTAENNEKQTRKNTIRAQILEQRKSSNNNNSVPSNFFNR